MIHLEHTIDTLVQKGIVENLAIRVGCGERILYDTFRGRVNDRTLFDMASVTKIMATTSLALIALDRGLLQPEETVSRFYPTDKPLTIRNLLTHTIGIGHKSLNQEGNNPDNIAQIIVSIPLDIPIGSDVLYSCPGFILLAKILEKIFGKKLDQAFEELVAGPLGLTDTVFLPKERENIINANLETEKKGIVNDYNRQFLKGVAGNAGLFSNLSDVTKYVQFLLRRGEPLFAEETFSMAVQNYTGSMSESRGLGFLYVDPRYTQTGGLFPTGSIGHCGHTGQSVFVDLRSGLYVIILSDATVSTIRKYGSEHYDEVMELRRLLHEAIKKDLNERG